MTERILVLEGSIQDRGLLLNQDWTSELRVEHDGAFFRLHAPSLLTADSDELAFDKGDQLVRWINGAAALLDASYVGVYVVEVQHVLPNGKLHRSDYRPAPRGTAAGGGAVQVKHHPLANASIPLSQQPPLVRWVISASRDSSAAGVLEFVNAEAGRWAQLYRTVEAVRLALGNDFASVVGDELNSKTELFGQSANYAQPGDRHKRHPHKGGQPKKKDMPLPEAEDYTRAVVTAFLNHQAKRISH